MGMEIWRRRAVTMVAVLGMMAAVLMTGGTRAQAQGPTAKPMGSIPAGETYVLIQLNPMTSQNEANDLQTAMRNVLYRTRIYFDYSQHAMAIVGTEEDVETARRMVAELDKPQVAYRLSYTIAVKDGDRMLETRKYSMTVDNRGRAEMKQGRRVPIAMTTTDAKSSANAQVQYLDVGLAITAELDGARLRSKVQETKLSGSKSVMGVADPVVEQTELNGNTLLVVGKPLVLGTLDVPNSTRQEVVEVTVEPVE
jgi:hypothetical protein